MKKLMIILAFLIVLVLALPLTACGALSPRTPLTAEQFTAKMEEAGMTVTDLTDDYDPADVKTVLIAYNDNYQIEYYQLASLEIAENMFTNNRQLFEDNADSSTTTELNGKNFNYFAMTTQDGYFVVSRTEDTVIYVEESSDFKKELQDLVKSLGY